MRNPKAHSLEKAFGEAVRASRLRLGISQEKLAAQSGLHRTYVSQIERGLKSPSLDSMARLAAALKTSLPALIAGAASPRHSDSGRS